MVRYAPAAARSKVCSLDEAHMLTGEANPWPFFFCYNAGRVLRYRVIFVMLRTEPKILLNNRSRSQHFHFRALTFAR